MEGAERFEWAVLWHDILYYDTLPVCVSVSFGQRGGCSIACTLIYDFRAARPRAHLNRIRRRCSNARTAGKFSAEIRLVYETLHGVSLEAVTPSVHPSRALSRLSSSRASWIVLLFFDGVA